MLSNFGTDLSLRRVRDWPDVPRVDHGLREAPEEGVLAAGEPVDDGRRGALRLGRRLELLVGDEEPPVQLDVGVVVVVEGVRRCRVQVVQDLAVAVPRAPLGQERPVGRVQGRARHVGAAEVVEPVGPASGDVLALDPAERVGTCVITFNRNSRWGVALVRTVAMCQLNYLPIENPTDQCSEGRPWRMSEIR